MGDGGFWHNSLIWAWHPSSSKGGGVLIVMQNGYASATGQQYIPSSAASKEGPAPGMGIEQTLRALGVKWLRTVPPPQRQHNGEDAEEGDEDGGRGEGHHRGRRVPACTPAPRARGRRRKTQARRGVTRTRYGVDDEDLHGRSFVHALSGCPSLTVKPSPDPLRTDPVATVIESCVGCGLCGEVAHAADLVPFLLSCRNHS